MLVAITLIGIPIAVRYFDGAGVIAALGIINGIGQVARSLIVDWAARRGTPPVRGWWRPLARHVSAALLTIGVAAVAVRLVIDDHSRIGALAQVAIASTIGLIGYLSVQSSLRAPELPDALHRRLRFGVLAATRVRP